MSVKIYRVLGKDPFSGYRLQGQKPDRYYYSLGKVSFWSPEKTILAEDFHKIIWHYTQSQYDCSEILSIEKVYQVSSLLLGKTICLKLTITGGSHLFDESESPKLPVCHQISSDIS